MPSNSQNAGVKVLADRLGLSKATVSKALNGYPQVSEATRRKVLDAAAQLGYPVQGNASVSVGARKRVGWIYRTDSRTPGTTQLIACSGFQRTAQDLKDSNMDVLMLPLFLDTPEKTLLELITENHLDGAFLSDIKQNDVFFEEAKEVNVPLVFWGLPLTEERSNYGFVAYDSVSGVSMAMKHLLDLGHRRIGFLNGNRPAHVSMERLDGYMLALAHAGISYDPSLTWEGDYTFACGAPALEFFLQKGVTAVCCASDKMAIGLAHAAQQRGIAIPEDLSIVGYDNDPVCSSMFPQLTTVAQDFFRIGKVTATLMECLLQGMPVGPVSIPPELIVRGSTAAPKQK